MQNECCTYFSIISIHAPSRERRCITSLTCDVMSFQSTLPRGSDIHPHHMIPMLSEISIHAPSRERHRFNILCSCKTQFQSTLPRGSDITGSTLHNLLVSFQSTLPRGSDIPYVATFSYIFFYFNPRSLAGATLVVLDLSVTTGIFQSTLPRGSDTYY